RRRLHDAARHRARSAGADQAQDRDPDALPRQLVYPRLVRARSSHAPPQHRYPGRQQSDSSQVDSDRGLAAQRWAGTMGWVDGVVENTVPKNAGSESLYGFALKQTFILAKVTGTRRCRRRWLWLFRKDRHSRKRLAGA